MVGKVVAIAALLSGCSAGANDEEAGPPDERGAVNVDRDGIYAFGDEEWVLATNQETQNGTIDFWTNSRNERFSIEYIGTLTGGQTAQSQCESSFEFVSNLEPTVISPPEAVPGAPGWWWYVITLPGVVDVLYEGYYVDAPQGFDVEIHLDNGDMGRTRAASVLSTLKFL